MQKLIALKQHLENLGWWNPERIEEFGEEGEVEWSDSRDGAGLLLYRHTYSGIIELHGASGDIRDLLAHVQVWLHENAGDPDDNLLESWEGEPVERHRSDITLHLRFLEEVHYVPAAQGYEGADKITVAGADWQRGTATPDTADLPLGDIGGEFE